MRMPVLLFACAVSMGAQTPSREATEFFEAKVRPVLAGKCYACHSTRAKTPFAGLKLDSRAGALRGGDHGPAIVPGDAGASRMIQAVRGQGVAMPPGGKLSAEEIDALARWVSLGAPWPEETPASAAETKPKPKRTDHWSLQPVRPIRNGSIDEFVQARLKQQGLRLSPPADTRTLLRRVSYDLTGLPPSPDLTGLSYEAAVDRLLSSPHFGERWGRYWLDLARFSDTGFANVRYPFAFSYRDWVIEAYNKDLPYDKFIQYQLAADQLNAQQQLPALGLLSLGHNPPRVDGIPEKVDDRIDVVSRTFLGLTVSCARCHDHKYDPIPTRDYYSLYGVFVNTVEIDPQRVDASASPLDRFYIARLAERQQIIDDYKRQRIEDLRAEAREPVQVRKYLLAAWESREMTPPQVDNLSRERNVNLLILERWREWLKQHKEFRPEAADATVDEMAKSAFLNKPEAPPNIPLAAFRQVQTEGDFNTVNSLTWKREGIYADYAYRGGPRRAQAVEDRATIEPAHVLVRGNMNDLGPAVDRQFLSAVAPASVKFGHGSGRVDLAMAIVDPANPLTSRVMANRVWQHLFGEGLVRTPSDFGIRGEAPTHPELLDYLATTFREDGWSVKRLIRRIVLSDTYRQASADVPAARQLDPENRLLWRQNRRRLDFEALRDTMLAAAGRLDPTIGGPSFSLSVVPAVPRRTMYAFVERERANALLKSFNYADPEQHTAQRHLTTVPQQALFLINSPFLHEQARALAERSADVRALYRNALGRDPNPQEAALAQRFVNSKPAASDGANAPGAWTYGYGAFDPMARRVTSFHRFTYFTGTAWQANSLLPDPVAGNAFLTATGGAPGDNLNTAAIRRWTADAAATVDIEGTLTHSLNQFEQRFRLTNGIRGWIVSSRHGVLGSWTFDAPEPRKEFKPSDVRKVSTDVKAVRVEPGDVIDFVVDSRDDYESDDFQWAPVIRASGGRTFDAAKDFSGPAPKPLTPWEQLAQVILLTNELAFLD